MDFVAGGSGADYRVRAVRRGVDRSARSVVVRKERCGEVRAEHGAGDGRSELRSITLGHPLVDAYLEFVGARGAMNTWLATAYDLKVFFEVVGKEPAEVTAADVFAFLAQQRTPRRREGGADRGRGGGVVGEDDRAAAVERGGLVRVSDRARRRGGGSQSGAARSGGPSGGAARPWRGAAGAPPRTLPRVLSPVEVDGLLGALRTQRDRAMVLAMLLGGLRRCEVLGVRLCDVNAGRAAGVHHVGEGRPGADRAGLGPVLRGARRVSGVERPHEVSTEACFVVLKGPRRGLPLSAAGLDEVLDGARGRAGVSRVTCHHAQAYVLDAVAGAGDGA